MKVPFFPYSRLFSQDKDAYLNIFEDVGLRGAFILQNEVDAFEAKLKEITGSNYVVSLANATDAIQLGLMASGINKGDEVIISSHTMIATASAIVYAGGVPVPVECGDDHLMDPDSAEKAINDKTFAIMPTQLNGRVANMDPFLDISSKYGIQIHEDSAQALGAKYKNKCAGTFGSSGCISFYPAKTLGCFGDGGALLVQDKDIYEKVMMMRDHGRNHENDVVIWGMNSRLDNIQAAFMLHKLKSYQSSIDRRREIAEIYISELSEIEDLILPPAPSDGDHYDIFQNFEIRAERRDELQKFLSMNEIGTLVQWSGKAVHQFKKLGFECDLPKTDDFFKKMIMLPLSHISTDEEIHYVCSKVKEFYN